MLIVNVVEKFGSSRSRLFLTSSHRRDGKMLIKKDKNDVTTRTDSGDNPIKSMLSLKDKIFLLTVCYFSFGNNNSKV